MKRVNTDNQLLYYTSTTSSLGPPSPTTPSSPCVANSLFKKSKPQFSARPPSTYIPASRAEVISLDILHTLESLDPMDHDLSYFRFVFFLGAQGKEYIRSIQEQFPFDIPVLFITSNSDGCTNLQCKELMTYFEIKDPMGAGIYPLDFLLIIHGDKVHCKVPINFSAANTRVQGSRGGISGHLKFGVALYELPSLIEEYVRYK
ncbi:hypothetical protein Cantr_01063 [Candida viswanathii]|uniref:Uncharacterized protein n=1 Tax=Candida viswanathii TaxID=5486 RepID=A0A367YI32_9ASCO|nr:hypothetical protein Cantr_01063 [Candida viswanathii]